MPNERNDTVNWTANIKQPALSRYVYGEIFNGFMKLYHGRYVRLHNPDIYYIYSAPPFVTGLVV